MTLRVSESLLVRVSASAASSGLTVSEWCRRAIEAYEGPGGDDDRLVDVERRLARLEDLAGL